MVDLAKILIDLHDESTDLDRLVADLPDDGWRRQTPAKGWTVAHQIAHLTWTDRVAIRSITDPEGFAEVVAAAAAEPDGFTDRAAADGLAEPAELLRRWRESRSGLAAALTAAPADARLPWFGVDMSPASMATARLMETWAHGEDISQGLGRPRVPTRRLRHVAWLGWRTLGYGFMVHGRPAPASPVYVELQAPDGGAWAFGSPDAADRVTGPALDFCLLVTQRQDPAELDLHATGPVAEEWLEVAQAFAGPPGRGRRPKSARSETAQPEAAAGRTGAPPGEPAPDGAAVRK